MNIVKLTAENIKKLKAVQITPDGNVVLLTGKNGAGKSSVLDSIVYALCGGKDLPQMPIRDGQTKGQVELDLGEVTVKRTFTEKNSYLEVKNKDGFKASSPQALLDEIVGKISFDPLAFVNEPDQKVQRKILLNLVGIDLSEHDARIQTFKVDRTGINQERTRLKVELEKYPIVNAPKEKFEISELVMKLEKATKKNNEYEAGKRDHEDGLTALTSIKELIDEHKAKIATLEKQHTEKDKEVKNLFEKWVKYAVQDCTKLTKLITDAGEQNKLFDKAEKRQQIQTTKNEADKHYSQLSKDIEAVEAEKIAVLKKAQMPIEGLSVGDDCVYYNGVPIDQIASSEKLRVGVAVSMALNPKLKVLRVTDGSLLDSENLKTISDMVRDKDYQIWIERVDESGQVGIVIEDGMVVNEKAVNSPA